MSKYSDYQIRISQATKSELNIITFELCINYIEDALEVINKDDTLFVNNINTSLSFLREIIVSLNYDYDISKELLEIYLYCNKLLIEGMIKKDSTSLEDAIYMLETIKDGFSQIKDTGDDQKVMQNSQKVFAGLTYGKGGLDEYVDITGKGFKA